MLALPSHVKVFVCAQPTDLRNGFEGLIKRKLKPFCPSSYTLVFILPFLIELQIKSRSCTGRKEDVPFGLSD
jgi:hypothetical protein